VFGQPPFSFRFECTKRRAVLLTAWGLSFAPLGCQQLPITTAIPTSVVAEQSQQIPTKLSVNPTLRKQLLNDHWRAASIWPEPLAGPAAFEQLRNRPLVRWERQQIRNLETSTDGSKEAESTESSAANQPENKRRRDQTLQNLLELEQLAQEDSLAGWNACIQLAWKQPRVDSQVLKQLETLALNPSKYDAETGFVETVEQTKVVPETEPEQPWWQRYFEREETASSDEQKTETETPATVPESQPGTVLSDRFRAAAAEAWCWQLSQLPGDAEQHFAAAGLALQTSELPDVVRWELQRGIARSIPPRRIPGLAEISAEAHSGPLSEAERTLLDACITHALFHPELAADSSDADAIMLDETRLDPHGLWPTALWEYRWSDQPDVVNRFGLWLALTRHPLAESYLRQSLQHIEPAVHGETLRNLGLLGTAAAQELLTEQAREKEGTPRAIALLGLAREEESTLFAAVDDTSAVVRKAVASFAGTRPSARSAQVLRQLAEDHDPVVQQAAVAAVQDWDAELAFPILATAFQQGSVPTRKLARRALETRFDLVIAAIDDDAEQRQQTLRQISERFDVSADKHLLAMKAESTSDDRIAASSEIPEEARLRHQQAISRLNDPATEAVARQSARDDLTELLLKYPRLFTEDLNALPVKELADRVKLYADFSFEPCPAVRDLSHDDLYRRRKAARELANRGAEETLPEWALRSIAAHITNEQDIHVCRSLIQAIAHDTTPAARAVAEAALVHSWPDVRILGCRYAAEHRLPQLAPFVLPLLHERNPSVQLEAIQTAGLCRNPLVIDGFPGQPESGNTGLPEQSGGLRSLLGTVPPTVEFEVITSLARLGDDQGQMELLKLCYSPAAERRIQAVSLLGELGDGASVDHLIRLGWTEQDPGVRNAILNSLNQLVSAERRPKFPTELDSRAQLERWAQWREEQTSLGQ